MHHRNELLDLADWIDGVQGAPGSKWSEIVRSLADGAPAQGALPQTPTNLRQSMLDAAKDQARSAAPAQQTLNQEAADQSAFDNPRDPFASPDRLPNEQTERDRQWIINLIRSEYDKAPDYFRAGDNWVDGTGSIADQIIARYLGRATALTSTPAEPAQGAPTIRDAIMGAARLYTHDHTTALKITEMAMSSLTSTNPEIERCPDCGQELPIRYPCHEQGCMIKCRF